MKRGIPRPGGIPRPQQGGSRLPQMQPVATRVVQVQQVQPVAQVSALQAPRRVIGTPRTAPKVRSAPVIAVAAPKTVSRIIRAPGSRIIPAPGSRIIEAPASRIIEAPASRIIEAPASRIIEVPASRIIQAPASIKKIPAPRQIAAPSRLARPATGLPQSTRKVVRTAKKTTRISLPPSPVRVGNEIVMVPNEVVQVTPVRVVQEVVAPAPRTPPPIYAPEMATANIPATPVYSPIGSPSRYGYACVSPLENEPMPAELSMFDLSPVANVYGSPVSNVVYGCPVTHLQDTEAPVELSMFPSSPEQQLVPRRRTPRFSDPRRELFGESPVFYKSVVLQSPSRGQVILDMAVNPRPMVETESGEHVVCDIALNVRDPQMGRRRDYLTSPVSAGRRRLARRSLMDCSERGLFRELNAPGEDLDTSIEWEYPVVGGDDAPYDLITFSPGDLIDFS